MSHASDPGKKYEKKIFGPGPPGLWGLASEVGRRLFSSTCIEEMRNSTSRQVRLAHDNSSAQGGVNFRLDCFHGALPTI